MAFYQLVKEQFIPASLAEVWEFILNCLVLKYVDNFDKIILRK
jgi:hypothetical protein